MQLHTHTQTHTHTHAHAHARTHAVAAAITTQHCWGPPLPPPSQWAHLRDMRVTLLLWLLLAGHSADAHGPRAPSFSGAERLGTRLAWGAACMGQQMGLGGDGLGATTCTYVQTGGCTHASTHACTHSHTHAHAHTNAHTHTHVHAHANT